MINPAGYVHTCNFRPNFIHSIGSAKMYALNKDFSVQFKTWLFKKIHKPVRHNCTFLRWATLQVLITNWTVMTLAWQTCIFDFHQDVLRDRQSTSLMTQCQYQKAFLQWAVSNPPCFEHSCSNMSWPPAQSHGAQISRKCGSPPQYPDESFETLAPNLNQK